MAKKFNYSKKIDHRKDNKTKNRNSILLVILSTIFTSLAQLLFKFGSQNLTLSIDLIYNWQLILGLAFYGIGAILLIYALKSDDLNYLYPFLSLSLIWVSLISLFLFDESINWMHALG